MSGRSVAEQDDVHGWFEKPARGVAGEASSLALPPGPVSAGGPARFKCSRRKRLRARQVAGTAALGRRFRVVEIAPSRCRNTRRDAMRAFEPSFFPGTRPCHALDVQL